MAKNKLSKKRTRLIALIFSVVLASQAAPLPGPAEALAAEAAPFIVSVVPAFTHSGGLSQTVEPWGEITIKFSQQMDPRFGSVMFGFNNHYAASGRFQNNDTEYSIRYDVMHLRGGNYFYENMLTFVITGFINANGAVQDLTRSYYVRPEPFVVGGSPAMLSMGGANVGIVSFKFNMRMDTSRPGAVTSVDREGRERRVESPSFVWGADGMSCDVIYGPSADGPIGFYLSGFYSLEGYEMRQRGHDRYFGKAFVQMARGQLPLGYAYGDVNFFEAYGFGINWLSQPGATPTPTPAPSPTPFFPSPTPVAPRPGSDMRSISTVPSDGERDVPKDARLIVEFPHALKKLGDLYVDGKLWRVGGSGMHLRDAGKTVYLPTDVEFGVGWREVTLKGFFDEYGRIPDYSFWFEVGDGRAKSDWVTDVSPSSAKPSEQGEGIIVIRFNRQMDASSGFVWLNGLKQTGEWSGGGFFYRLRFFEIGVGVHEWGGRGFRDLYGNECSAFDYKFFITDGDE